MLQEAENGLREFAESSKELEQEMERELTQSAKDLEDARTRNEKLGQDKEEWKVSPLRHPAYPESVPLSPLDQSIGSVF